MKEQEALTYVEMLEKLVVGLAKRVKEAETVRYADIGKECFTSKIGPYKFFSLPDPAKAKQAAKRAVGAYCMKQGERFVEESDPMSLIQGWANPKKQAEKMQKMIIKDCAEAAAGMSAGCVGAVGENVRSTINFFDKGIENYNSLSRMFGWEMPTFIDYSSEFVKTIKDGDLDGLMDTYAKNGASIDPKQPAAIRVVKLLSTIE